MAENCIENWLQCDHHVVDGEMTVQCGVQYVHSGNVYCGVECVHHETVPWEVQFVHYARDDGRTVC